MSIATDHVGSPTVQTTPSPPVPMLDLKAQYHSIKPEIDLAVLQVLESQQFILGPKVEECEQTIAQYCGCEYGIGVSSGTDALLLAAMAEGIGPGDEVITTPFTFFATAGCIARVGAKPVFVDICPKTYNLDPTQVESRITERTKAIMPVHLFGQCADMAPIIEIARRNDLAVIEDAAQAIGAEYRGQRAGSMAEYGCLSFFPSKNLGCAGDGGMVVTNDSERAERLRILRSHGAKPKYYHQFVGGNFRLDSIQAAIIQVKVAHLDDWSAARRRNAEYYNQRFDGTLVETPTIRPGCLSVYNQYVVRVPRRDELLDHLKANGVGCEVYYPRPLHLQECFKHLGYRAGALPIAERTAGEVLAIPIYSELTYRMKERVADVILDFYI